MHTEPITLLMCRFDCVCQSKTSQQPITRFLNLISMAELLELFEGFTDQDKVDLVRVELDKQANEAGFLQTVVEIIASEEVEEDCKLPAAITLFNSVKKHWKVDELKAEEIAQTSDEEKEFVRSALVQLYTEVSRPVRSHLNRAISYIGKIDFPHNYGDLLEFLQAFGEAAVEDGEISVDVDLVQIILGLFSSVMDKYVNIVAFSGEHMDEIAKEIEMIVNSLFKPIYSMLNIFIAQIVANYDRKTDLMICSIVSIINKMTQQDMSELISSKSEELIGTMIGLTEVTQELKTKMAIFELLTTYITKHSEELSTDLVMSTLGAGWTTFEGLESDNLNADDVSIRIIETFRAISKSKFKDKLLDLEVLPSIVEGIIVPSFLPREIDVDQYSEDPYGFLQVELEGLSEGTKKSASIEFLGELIKALDEDSVKVLFNPYVENWRDNSETRISFMYILTSILTKKRFSVGILEATDFIDIDDFVRDVLFTDLQSILSDGLSNENMMEQFYVSAVIRFITSFSLLIDPNIINEFYVTFNSVMLETTSLVIGHLMVFWSTILTPFHFSVLDVSNLDRVQMAITLLNSTPEDFVHMTTRTLNMLTECITEEGEYPPHLCEFILVCFSNMHYLTLTHTGDISVCEGLIELMVPLVNLALTTPTPPHFIENILNAFLALLNIIKFGCVGDLKRVVDINGHCEEKIENEEPDYATRVGLVSTAMEDLNDVFLELLKDDEREYIHAYVIQLLAGYIEVYQHNLTLNENLENYHYINVLSDLFGLDLQFTTPELPTPVELPEFFSSLFDFFLTKKLWATINNHASLVLFIERYLYCSSQLLGEREFSKRILGLVQFLLSKRRFDRYNTNIIRVLFSKFTYLSDLFKKLVRLLIKRYMADRDSEGQSSAFILNFGLTSCFFILRFGTEKLKEVFDTLKDGLFEVFLEKIFVGTLKLMAKVPQHRQMLVVTTFLLAAELDDARVGSTLVETLIECVYKDTTATTLQVASAKSSMRNESDVVFKKMAKIEKTSLNLLKLNYRHDISFFKSLNSESMSISEFIVTFYQSCQSMDAFSNLSFDDKEVEEWFVTQIEKTSE
ncbi:hypothetical protein PCE1_002535 [Barthelona sp. PCE]